MFLVVEFDDNSVAVAPSTWMEGTTCAWPPYKNVTVAVKNMEEPKKHWKRFGVRILGSYGMT